jgi:tetratricopeptide (TPR) repeat protein
MVQLAEFYRDTSPKDSALLQADQSGKLKSALDWLLGWRQGSAEKLAVEWFEAAGNAGHKAALMQLANWYEASGKKEEAREMLRRIVEPNEDQQEEEFPQIVHQAKGRLSGIRTV